jgi:hypothetical protein
MKIKDGVVQELPKKISVMIVLNLVYIFGRERFVGARIILFFFKERKKERKKENVVFFRRRAGMHHAIYSSTDAIYLQTGKDMQLLSWACCCFCKQNKESMQGDTSSSKQDRILLVHML